MSNAAHTGNIERIKLALAHHDDTGLTTKEVAAICNLSRDQAAGLLRCLHKTSPMFPRKRIHIAYWRHEGEPGEKIYPRAVYKLGDMRDCPKPQPKETRKKNAEYRARQRLKNQGSSVFNLGNTGYRVGPQRERQEEYARRSERAQMSLFPDAIEMNEIRKERPMPDFVNGGKKS